MSKSVCFEMIEFAVLQSELHKNEKKIESIAEIQVEKVISILSDEYREKAIV